MSVLLAAFGLFLAESLRRSSADKGDDEVGLFIGSARPLAATALSVAPAPIATRSQKRAQLF
jgi:hypothetical protein